VKGPTLLEPTILRSSTDQALNIFFVHEHSNWKTILRLINSPPHVWAPANMTWKGNAGKPFLSLLITTRRPLAFHRGVAGSSPDRLLLIRKRWGFNPRLGNTGSFGLLTFPDSFSTFCLFSCLFFSKILASRSLQKQYGDFQNFKNPFFGRHHALSGLSSERPKRMYPVSAPFALIGSVPNVL